MLQMRWGLTRTRRSLPPLFRIRSMNWYHINTQASDDALGTYGNRWLPQVPSEL